MNFYIIIILFIKFSYILCNDCISCKIFPPDDVDLNLKLPTEDPNNSEHCGEYGFRCLDSQTFQICEIPEDQHSQCILDLMVTRECKDGYKCDEENPAYCTPIDKKDIQENSKCVTCLVKTDLKNDKEELNDANYNDDVDYLDESQNTRNLKRISGEFRDTRNSSDIPIECIECAGAIITTTDAPETTTVFIDQQIIPTEEPISTDFQCEFAGFYPDRGNQTNFWRCDWNENGALCGTHMQCKQGEIFSTQFHTCIIPEVSLESRTTNNLCRCAQKTSFTCTGKRSGKYSDKDNCRYYHVCVNSKLSPIKELLFVCPESTAFDPKTKKCTKSAVSRCTSGYPPLQLRNTNCCPPPQLRKTNFCQGINSRFREIADCTSYYLCTNKEERAIKVQCPKGYRVDDTIMDCLPKHIAQCANDNSKNYL